MVFLRLFHPTRKAWRNIIVKYSEPFLVQDPIATMLLLKEAKPHVCFQLLVFRKVSFLNRRLFLTAISAAILVGSFVIGSQLVQSSMAQELKEKVGGALQNLTGGANQTGNRTGESLENLGEKVQSALAGQ
jgi:hypothetical protein